MMSKDNSGILLSSVPSQRNVKLSEAFYNGTIKILWSRENKIQNIRVEGPLSLKGGPSFSTNRNQSEDRHPEITIRGVDWVPGINLVPGCGFSKTLLFNTTTGSRAREGEDRHHAYLKYTSRVFTMNSAEVSSLHLGTGHLRKFLKFRSDASEAPVFLCDYKHGILVFIKCRGLFDGYGWRDQADMLFISMKTKKVLFSVRRVIQHALELWVEPSISFSDGKMMVIDFAKETAFGIDLFRRKLIVIPKKKNQLVLVAGIDSRYPQAYPLKNNLLLFEKLLVMLKEKPKEFGAKVYYQRDYTEAASDDAVFGPCRESGHFVDIAAIEKKTGQLILRDCIRGKVLAGIKN